MNYLLKSGKFLAVLSIFATQFNSAQSHADVLWNNWYEVTNNGAPDYYYNEISEITNDKVKVKINYWFKEGNKVRRENFGGTAKNTPELQPLLFNFMTQENGVEKIMDGTILNNGKIFSVKIKRGGKTSKPIHAEMLPNLTLVSFFPVWIHKNYKKISSVQPKDFMAIIEDQVDQEVPVGKGNAYEMVADDYSKKTNTRKIRVQFRNIVAFWYVTKMGDAVRISFPSLNKEVKKVTQEEAEKFL